MEIAKPAEANVAARLSHAQRKLVASLIPPFAKRLQLEERQPRSLDFSEADLQRLAAALHASSPQFKASERNTAVRLLEALAAAVAPPVDQTRVYPPAGHAEEHQAADLAPP